MKKAFALTAAATLGLAGAAMATTNSTMTVDLSGRSSNGFQGDPGNVTIALGGFQAGDEIISVDYDVNATGVGVSWFEEMTYTLWDGAAGGTVAADGANGDLSYSPGSQTSFFVNSTAAGTHDLAAIFGSSYEMTSDTLTIELHEWSFDDEVGAPDAFYNSGSLTINYKAVPAPAGLAVLGLFGLARRRRR